MRVVSMVPSWTETLIEAGVDVVGRTRFCIHPEEKVRAIPVVGGTKNIDWKKLETLSADLLILDREENPKSMSEESPIEVLATHLRSVADVAFELQTIAQRLAKGRASDPARAFGPAADTSSAESAVAALESLASRWRAIVAKPSRRLDWQKLPGVMEWLGDVPTEAFDHAIYLIWKDPDMAAGPGTFIASVLEKLGIEQSRLWPERTPDVHEASAKYPVVDWSRVSENTVILASSEPFPFHKRKGDLLTFGKPVAIVDGEAFSWFGLRSLRFLENSLK